MNINHVIHIARYHAKLLRRSCFFRVYVVFTFCCSIFIQLFFQSDIFGAFMSPALASAIPNTGGYLLEVFLVFPVLFCGSSLWSKRNRPDSLDAIYVRPVGNTDYILGVAWGMFWAFFEVNVIFLLASILVHLFGASSPFYVSIYLFYLVTLFIPSLVYMLGVAFFIKSWVGNQALSLLILFGYVIMVFSFLDDYKQGIFDPLTLRFPSMISEIIGHPDLQGYLLRRGCWFLVGCGLLGYSMITFKRLSNTLSGYRIQGIAASVLVLGGLLCGHVAFSLQQEEMSLRKKYVNTYCKYSDRAKLKLVSLDIFCEQVGKGISGESCMVVKNEMPQKLSEVLLYLNPLLEVTQLTCAGKELFFERENQIIVINKTLSPGETCELKLKYVGSIDENICYLDVPDNSIFGTDRHKRTDTGKRYVYLEDRFTLLLPECLWYPVTVPPVNPVSSFHVEKNFTDYSLKVIAPEKMVISPGERTEIGDSVIFKNEYPLPGIFLCIGDYEKASLTVDSVDFELYVFKGHGESIFQMEGLGDVFSGVLFDLKCNIESDKGRRYPFKRFMLVEIPLSFMSYYRNERGGSENVQPECIFLPERGNGIIIPRMTKGKGESPESEKIFEEDENARILLQVFASSNFMNEYKPLRLDIKNRILSASFGRNVDFFKQEKNITDISSLFFDYTVFIHSSEIPVIDMVIKMLLRNENVVKFDGMMPVSNQGHQNAIHYLAGNSFKDAMTDKDISADFFYELLKVKSEDLRNLVLLAGISSERFREFLFDFMERNSFREVEFSQLNKECVRVLGIDLMDLLPSWYETDQVPKFIIRDFVTRWIKNDPSEERPRRDSKMQIQFSIYNDSKVDGVVSFFSEYHVSSGSGNTTLRNKKVMQKNFLIEAGVGKEITFVVDQLLTSGAINTNISCNLPNEIRFNMYPYLPTQDTSQRIVERDSSFFYPSSREIIVDNEDDGFHVFDAETRNKWLYKSKVSKMGHGDKSIMGVIIPRWTYFVDAGYYGNHVRSGVSKTAGKGDSRVEWRTVLPESGEYEVFAYMYQSVNIRMLGKSMRYQVGDKIIDMKNTGKVMGIDAVPKQYYTVFHTGGEEEVIIETKGISGWISLGRYYFSSGENKISLSDKGEPYQEIEADAMKWVKCK